LDLKTWNENIKKLRSIILKPESIDESKKLALELHAMVHLSEMSGVSQKTFEDELWAGLDENKIKNATNEKGRTIAYGLWHSSRIEDITMNILVSGDEQVINTGNYIEKINSNISDTGNALNCDEILEFSKNININELRNYRIAVGRKTREIIKNLNASDMKRKFEKDSLNRILAEGAVLDVEAANWLIDFWGKKNVAGIILMPATRHHVVHINESLRVK
jgi:hypothetical protein